MSTAPRALDRFPPEQIAALRRALAEPGTWFQYQRGIPAANVKTQQNNLDALKAGLKLHTMQDPALTKAALERRMHFRKVKSGESHWGFDVMIAACPIRPSDIAREYLAALARGEKPTPPLD